MIAFLKSKRGFALLEVVIGTAVFVLFAVGIFAGIQFVFKSVYFSRVRIIQTGVLNEQVEIIRNIPFEDVGIINGSPSGVLTRTVTTTRNGIPMTITRTIRNIDDPFDGLIGGSSGTCSGNKVAVCHNGNTLCVGAPAEAGHLGHGDTSGPCESTPNDTAPADYKLVDISIICDSCGQQNPVLMSTFVAPKFLEGDPTHGALKIVVYENDYQGLVQGAEVHIVATSTDPAVDFIDTTNNDGELLIVDLGSGVQAYHITVTKDGYTTDMTSTTGGTPIRPPATVVAQDLQTISFEIDPASRIDISTLDSQCQAIASAPIHVIGEKLLATDPDLQKVDYTFTTNGSGLYSMIELIPDDYSFEAQSHDIIGAIPILPLAVSAGTTNPLQLLLGANTAHSLLVHVQDNGNSQPVALADVQVTDGGSYDETAVTGVGHISQTDWSGGSGQEMFVLTDSYYSDDGNVDVTTAPGTVTLENVSGSYLSSGEFTSSIFDLGTAVDFVEIGVQPVTQPAQTGSNPLRFQIATSNTSTPGTWTYLGPDGTGSSYYSANSTTIHSTHNGEQYVRYKAFLSTDNASYTPTLSEFTLNYTTSCAPPGQGYFGGLSNQEYTVDVTADGYEDFNGTVTVDGDTFFAVSLIPE